MKIPICSIRYMMVVEKLGRDGEWGSWGAAAARLKGKEGSRGSAWYSRLTHSHRTRAPIRVKATLIKPDLQPLAAGSGRVHVNPQFQNKSPTVIHILAKILPAFVSVLTRVFKKTKTKHTLT